MDRRARISVILMAAGLALMTLGLWRGEAALVLGKALRVCLECIGVG